MKNSSPSEKFCSILESIDNRCIAADGPVSHPMSEATPNELHDLYVTAQQIKYEHKIVELFLDRMSRFGNWDENVFYYNGVAATELHEPILMAVAALPKKRARPKRPRPPNTEERQANEARRRSRNI